MDEESKFISWSITVLDLPILLIISSDTGNHLIHFKNSFVLLFSSNNVFMYFSVKSFETKIDSLFCTTKSRTSSNVFEIFGAFLIISLSVISSSDFEKSRILLSHDISESLSFAIFFSNSFDSGGVVSNNSHFSI